MLPTLREPKPRTSLRPTYPTSLGSAALSRLENEWLASLLHELSVPTALNLEQIDGLYCALIASPIEHPCCATTVPTDSATRLLKRHWDSIMADFDQEGLHVPVIVEPYVDGVPGRAWARGFMQGVGACATAWQPLFSDENEGYLISIPLLAGAIDPAWPRAPLTDRKIDEFLTWMSAGAARAYRYFADARWARGVSLLGEGEAAASSNIQPTALRPADLKIGRVALCPCGSHRKYKRCCGEFRTR